MTNTAPLTPAQQSTLLSLPGNSLCSECSTPNPSWASLSHGITLCLDCAGLHRGLGVHLSFVRSLTMDDWSEGQYRRMMRGGNARWNDAWKESNATVEFRERQAWKAVRDGMKERSEMRDAVRAKYESDTAKSYREMLKKDVDGAMSNDGKNDPSPSSSQSQTVSLAEEPPPTVQQCQSETWPFALALLTSDSKNLMTLLMWTVCGFGLASWVNQHGPAAYTNVLLTTIIGFTGFVPYYFVSNMSRTFAAGWINHRKDAFNSAKNLLIDLLSTEKACRLDSCDVYYPTSAVERKARVGLVFYPGALVDRTAYAPVASKLADAGVFVVIANLEPYRMVSRLKSYNTKVKVMRMISDSLFLGSGGLWEVEKWAIGGHSMGGNVAVAACANEMSSTMKKVVLWGVGTYPHPGMHPCKALRHATSGVDVLVLNGSNDKVIGFIGGKASWDDMEAKLPPRADGDSKSGQGCTFYLTIEGGNHSGCAHYGPQTFPVRDGDRTITLEQQQDRMAKLTADFLLGDYGKLNSNNR